MLTIERGTAPQAAISMSAEQALVIANKRFSNLASTGILGRRCTGPPIDLWQISKAMTVLAACRRSKSPRVHSYDLRAAIGAVSVGAVIAAAVALDFDVRSWLGDTTFAPHALIGVNADDIARPGRIVAA
jgi:hypothetical protein